MQLLRAPSSSPAQVDNLPQPTLNLLYEIPPERRALKFTERLFDFRNWRVVFGAFLELLID